MKVFIDSHLHITEYTDEQATIIKGDLKKDNPAFHSAELFSPYKRIAVPKYLYYYKENKKKRELIVPRGYKIPFDYEVTGEATIKNSDVDYPEFCLELRNAQKSAVEAYNNSVYTDAMIVMPTGSGKSITGLHLAYKYKQKTLIVVNKDDLIAGWRDDAKLCFGDKFKCGLIKAKKFEIGEFITLATIQTLCKLPNDKLEEVKKTFGMVIVDEQHRSASKSYEFISNLPAHRRVGFTATDIRNDGLRDVLDFYFRGVVYRCDDNAVKEDIITSEGIEVITRPSDIVYRVPKSYRWVDDNTLVTAIEWLNPRKIITNKDKEWAEAIKELLRDGEIAKIPINLHKVNAYVNADEKFMDTVVSDIVSECRLNRSCVVFCKEKVLVEKLNDLLLEKGFDNEDILMYYGNSKVTKEDLKERAETKKSLITLTTLAMATEGTNVKAWESIFLVSSIANEKDLIQAIGRVRRTKEGKDLVKIFDYSHPSVDGLKRHSAVRMAYYEKKGFRIK